MPDRNARNLNPGNIAYVEKNDWQGRLPKDDEIEDFFERFGSIEDGARALVGLLLGPVYRGSGVSTLLELTSKWAPRGHGRNDPESYARKLSAITGIGIDEPLDWSASQLAQLAWGIATHEGSEQDLRDVGFSEELVAATVAEVVGAAPPEDWKTRGATPIADPEGLGGAGGLGPRGFQIPDGESGAGEGHPGGTDADGLAASPALDSSGEFTVDEIALWMLRDETIELPYDFPAVDGSTIPAGTEVNLVRFIADQGLRPDGDEAWLFMQGTDWYRRTDKVQQRFDKLWWGAEIDQGSSPEGQLTPDEWFAVLPENYALDPQQEELIRDSKREVQRMISRFGVELTTDEVNRIAFFATRNGLGGAELRKWFAEEWSAAEWGAETELYEDAQLGTAGTVQYGTQSRLAELASRYMVPLGDLDDQDNDWVRRVLEAEDPEMEMSLIEGQMKEMAINNYPTIASYLKQGMSPQQFFTPYTNIASQLLERNVDFVGGDRMMVDAFASTADEKGSMRPMTWSEAREWVKGQDEWQYTRNAHEEHSDMVHRIGVMFGETT